MNTCPSCGKMAGVHGSILQGCTCQWLMQSMKEGKDFTISKPWVGLTDDDLRQIILVAIGVAEAKLKEKNT